MMKEKQAVLIVKPKDVTIDKKKARFKKKSQINRKLKLKKG